MLIGILGYFLYSEAFFVSICVLFVFLLIRHFTRVPTSKQSKKCIESTHYLDTLFYGELIAACVGATWLTNLLWEKSTDKTSS